MDKTFEDIVSDVMECWFYLLQDERNGVPDNDIRKKAMKRTLQDGIGRLIDMNGDIVLGPKALEFIQQDFRTNS